MNLVDQRVTTTQDDGHTGNMKGGRERMEPSLLRAHPVISWSCYFFGFNCSIHITWHYFNLYNSIRIVLGLKFNLAYSKLCTVSKNFPC